MKSHLVSTVLGVVISNKVTLTDFVAFRNGKKQFVTASFMAQVHVNSLCQIVHVSIWIHCWVWLI